MVYQCRTTEIVVGCGTKPLRNGTGASEGETLVPPYTRGSVSLSLGGQGESLVHSCTRGCIFRLG
jgi:hypothetical protein